MDIVQIKQKLPVGKGLRWFLAVDGSIVEGHGFTSKTAASEWIYAFGEYLDWRAGFVFRIKGLNVNLEIVDKTGKRARP